MGCFHAKALRKRRTESFGQIGRGNFVGDVAVELSIETLRPCQLALEACHLTSGHQLAVLVESARKATRRSRLPKNLARTAIKNGTKLSACRQEFRLRIPQKPSLQTGNFSTSSRRGSGCGCDDRMKKSSLGTREFEIRSHPDSAPRSRSV
jgi:hypothetical protein